MEATLDDVALKLISSSRERVMVRHCELGQNHADIYRLKHGRFLEQRYKTVLSVDRSGYLYVYSLNPSHNIFSYLLFNFFFVKTSNKFDMGKFIW